MPLVGTLAARLGRRRLYLGAIAGFCVAFMLSGSADHLSEIVIYRFLLPYALSPTAVVRWDAPAVLAGTRSPHHSG